MNAPFIPSLSAPLIATFEIASDCPYNCIFCEADIPYTRKLHKTLSQDQYSCVLKKLADANVFMVFFTGGEPLLNPFFPRLFEITKGYGMHPVVSTNAFLLKPSLISAMKRIGINNIQVSIEGPNDVHDKIVRKKGAFEIVIKKVKSLVQAGIQVEVACVGLKENFEHIPGLLKILAETGVWAVRILRYVPSHRKEMLSHIPPLDIVKKTVPSIIKTAKEYNIEIFLGSCPGVITTVPYTLAVVHPMAHFCQAGKTDMTILPNGDVAPCLSLRNRKEMIVGNLLSDSVGDVWNHPIMRKFRFLSPADYRGICGDCQRKWICYSARCVALNIDGDLYGDDISCYVVREQMGIRDGST